MCYFTLQGSCLPTACIPCPDIVATTRKTCSSLVPVPWQNNEVSLSLQKAIDSKGNLRNFGADHTSTVRSIHQTMLLSTTWRAPLCPTSACLAWNYVVTLWHVLWWLQLTCFYRQATRNAGTFLLSFKVAKFRSAH